MFVVVAEAVAQPGDCVVGSKEGGVASGAESWVCAGKAGVVTLLAGCIRAVIEESVSAETGPACKTSSSRGVAGSAASACAGCASLAGVAAGEADDPAVVVKAS